MGRLADWPDRLNAHIEKWRHRKFRWGTSDCSMFVLQAEKAMCGESRFQDFVGKYRSEDGSKKALEEIGSGTLEATLDDRLQPIPLKMAMRGDVALKDTPNGEALSLVIGQQVAVMSKEGLVFHPLSAVKKVWRV